MAPDSRPPLSHIRPTLSTRLRKSFEGKRSKSETAPSSSNGSTGPDPDPDALRLAIERAIMGETFQKAIAANLANILKPSIKSALDTIQPVVEAVYSHDILLRKTNKSVEQLLEKMETIPEVENAHEVRPQQERSASAGSFYDMEFKALLEKSNKRTVANLAELSNAVQATNSKIAGLEVSFGETKESMDYLKAHIQNEMDHLQDEVGRISENIESQRKAGGTTTSLFSAQANKLDLIASGLAGLKGYSELSEKLESVSGELNALRASLEAGIDSNNRGFGESGVKLDHVTNAIQAHGTALNDIRQANTNPDILAAVQRSNDAHDSHALVLSEIKERSIAGPGPLDTTSSETASALQDIKSRIEALKDNFKLDHTSKNDNVSQLGSKIDNVLATIEEYKASDASADILSALQKSNDSHDSHSSALDGFKSLLVVPTPTNSNNLAAVESQLSSILDTLSDLKSRPATPPIPIESLQSEITTVATTLTTHTKLLKQLKDNVSAEILTALHDIGQTQSSHTTTLTEIREADVSDEILTALHTSNEAHNGHQAEFEKLHGAVRGFDERHEKHGLALGEIRSRSLDEVPVPIAQGSIGDLDPKISSIVSILEEIKSRSLGTDGSSIIDLETKITGIVAHLEEQKSSLASIQNSTNAAADSHASHALSLDEIKSRSLEPVSAPTEPLILRDLETKIIDIISILEGQSVALATIKDSTHSAIESHTSSLEDIKAVTTAQRELHESHASVLSEIKDAGLASKDLSTAHSLTLADLVIATGAANESHASHASVLADLKALPSPPPVDLSAIPALEADLKNILATLSSNTAILSEINSSSSRANPDIVASIQASHNLLASHTSLLDTIKKLSSTSHEELLTSLTSLKTTLEDTKSDVNTHGTLVKDLHSKTEDSHSSLTTAISSLALGGAAGAGAGLLISKDDDEVSSEELLREVKTVRELVEGGVWFSDKGLEQLKATPLSGPVVSVKEVGEGDSVSDGDSVGGREKLPAIEEEEDKVDPIIIADQQHKFNVATTPDVAKEAVVERSITAIKDDDIPIGLPTDSSIEVENQGSQPLEDFEVNSAVHALQPEGKKVELFDHETSKDETPIPSLETTTEATAQSALPDVKHDVSEAHLTIEPEPLTKAPAQEDLDEKAPVSVIASETKLIESPVLRPEEPFKSEDTLDQTVAEIIPADLDIGSQDSVLPEDAKVSHEAVVPEDKSDREIEGPEADRPVPSASATEEEKEEAALLSPPVVEVVNGSSISNEKYDPVTDSSSAQQNEDDSLTPPALQETISLDTIALDDDTAHETLHNKAKEIILEGNEREEGSNLTAIKYEETITTVASADQEAPKSKSDDPEESVGDLASADQEALKSKSDDLEESVGDLAPKSELGDDDLEVEWSGKDDNDVSAPLPSIVQEIAASHPSALEMPARSATIPDSPLLSATATVPDDDPVPEATVEKEVSPVTEPQKTSAQGETTPSLDVFQFLEPSSEDEPLLPSPSTAPVLKDQASPEPEVSDPSDLSIKEVESTSPISVKGKEVEIPSEDKTAPNDETLEELEDWTPVDVDQKHSQPEEAASVSPSTDDFVPPTPTSEKGVASPKLPEDTDSEPATPVTPLTPNSSLKKAASKKVKKGKKGKKDKVRFEMDGDDP